MVMAVENMLKGMQQYNDTQLSVARAFVSLLNRTSAPLGNCKPGFAYLINFLKVMKTARMYDSLGQVWRSQKWRPCNNKVLSTFNSARSDWRSCKGAYPTTRGYTCSLWLVLHMAVANTDDAHAAADMVTIRNYVRHYFACNDCRDHFLQMSTNVASEVSNKHDAVLWLWQAHNTVNERLRQEKAAETSPNLFKWDPRTDPKTVWPTASECPECRHAPASAAPHFVHDAAMWEPGASLFNEQKLVEFLTLHYGAKSSAQLACTGTSIINTQCGGGATTGGVPNTCSARCAAAFEPWYAQCGARLAGSSPEFHMRLAMLHSKCSSAISSS